MACLTRDDRECAVREVARVYELIKTHYPLLLHHQGMQATTTQLLLGEALRALNVALSVMKQQEGSGTAASPVAARPELSSSASKGVTTSTSARNGKRRRSKIEGGKVEVKLIPFPYGNDGYEWRKYGEKRINGSHFTRSYFRCTYKDDKGCPATKYVQQKDNSDPPQFQVTYNNDHTCNCKSSLPTGAAGINNPPICHVQQADSSDYPPQFQVTYNNDHIRNCNNNLPTGSSGAAFSNSPIDHHDAMILNQEATFFMPSLADVSAVPLDDLMPCHEPFTIIDQYVTIGTPGDSSCLPNELDMEPIVTGPLIGDDPELLCNTFP